MRPRLRPGDAPAPRRALRASFSASELFAWRIVDPSTRRRSQLHLSLGALRLQRVERGTPIEILRIDRGCVEPVLRQAVLDAYDPDRYRCKQSWRLATRFASVLIRWIPDADAAGRPLRQEAPLLVIRGCALRDLESQWRAAPVDPAAPAPATRPYPIEPELLASLCGRSP